MPSLSGGQKFSFPTLFDFYREVLLNTLCNMCDLGKCLSTKWRNDLAIFVWTFSLYGGLNQMMFLGLFLRL